MVACCWVSASRLISLLHHFEGANIACPSGSLTKYSSKLLLQLKDDRDVVETCWDQQNWHTKVKADLWVEATPFAHGSKPAALTPK